MNTGIILKTTNGGFPVGINEKHETTGLKINPNPAKEKISIELPVPGTGADETIIVYGMTGQEMIRRQAYGSPVAIDVSSLQQGIYFVRFLNNGKTESGKFVKE